MSKDIKILLFISALFSLTMGLSSIFINVFFWRETRSFITIAIYNLMQYILGSITFIGAGWLAKKKNSIWPLRMGLLIFLIFFSILLAFGNKGIYYIYLLGAIFGIASGFYWLAFNTLSFDLTSVNNRDTFNGYNGGFVGIASAVAPISSGFIISRFEGVKGYYVVFIASLCLFLLLFIISNFLKAPSHSSNLNFNKIFSNNCNDWKCIRVATLLWGFRDIVIIFIINILIILATGSELSLGEFSLTGALISSGAFIMVQRIIKPNKRKLSIYIGVFGSYGALLGLFIGINYSTLLIYTILNSFFLPFYVIQFSSATFNVINRTNEEESNVEYMINRELVLNYGRIISTSLLLILFSSFKDMKMLKFFLLFIGAFPLVSSYYLGKLNSILGSK